MLICETYHSLLSGPLRGPVRRWNTGLSCIVTPLENFYNKILNTKSRLVVTNSNLFKVKSVNPDMKAKWISRNPARRNGHIDPGLKP